VEDSIIKHFQKTEPVNSYFAYSNLEDLAAKDVRGFTVSNYIAPASCYAGVISNENRTKNKYLYTWYHRWDNVLNFRQAAVLLEQLIINNLPKGVGENFTFLDYPKKEAAVGTYPKELVPFVIVRYDVSKIRAVDVYIINVILRMFQECPNLLLATLQLHRKYHKAGMSLDWAFAIAHSLPSSGQHNGHHELFAANHAFLNDKKSLLNLLKGFSIAKTWQEIHDKARAQPLAQFYQWPPVNSSFTFHDRSYQLKAQEKLNNELVKLGKNRYGDYDYKQYNEVNAKWRKETYASLEDMVPEGV
jgi:hypothetical protein